MLVNTGTESGFVLSDLHIQAQKTIPERIPEPLERTAAQAAFIILNGDIFEFGKLPEEEQEAAAEGCIQWLDFLVNRFPRCRFIYVLGNHDGFALFAEKLDRLSQRRTNLEWHPSHYRRGKSLFLHGDLVLDHNRAQPFQRKMNRLAKRKNPWLNAIYKLVVLFKAHAAVGLLYGKKRCAGKILDALAVEKGPWAAGIKKIYFGHIHTPFRDFEYRGVSFNNPGSLFPGLECSPLALEFPSSRKRQRATAALTKV